MSKRDGSVMTRKDERELNRLNKEKEVLWKQHRDISFTLSRLEEQNAEWLKTIKAVKTSKQLLADRMNDIERRQHELRKIRA